VLANFQIPVDATKVVVIGKNLSSSFLYRGTIVYLTSDGSKRPVFVKAQANSELSSEHTFGVIDNDIPPNTEGPCVTIGTLDALDTRSTAAHPFTTDTLVDGDTLYLSPTVAGYVTNVQPAYPNQIIKVGQVIKTTPQTGVIIYRIQQAETQVVSPGSTVVATTSPFTPSVGQYYIYVDMLTPCVINLPSIALSNPNGYNIKNIGESTVKIVPLSPELIDEQTEINIKNAYTSLELVHTTTNWYIV